MWSVLSDGCKHLIFLWQLNHKPGVWKSHRRLIILLTCSSFQTFIVLPCLHHPKVLVLNLKFPWRSVLRSFGNLLGPTRFRTGQRPCCLAPLLLGPRIFCILVFISYWHVLPGTAVAANVHDKELHCQDQLCIRRLPAPLKVGGAQPEDAVGNYVLSIRWNLHLLCMLIIRFLPWTQPFHLPH